jgi:hypothetical protein
MFLAAALPFLLTSVAVIAKFAKPRFAIEFQ